MKSEYDSDEARDDWRARGKRHDDLGLSSHVAADTLRESLKMRPTALK